MQLNKDNEMKKIILVLVFVLLPLQVFAQKYKVNANNLNIRKSPSSSSRILGRTIRDTLLTVLSINNNWAKIQYNDGYGYVNADYLDSIDPAVMAQPIVMANPQPVTVVQPTIIHQRPIRFVYSHPRRYLHYRPTPYKRRR